MNKKQFELDILMVLQKHGYKTSGLTDVEIKMGVDFLPIIKIIGVESP